MTNDNKRMNPILLVILIIIGLNVLGFLLKMFFQFAGLALFVLIVYLILQKVRRKW